MNRGALLLFCAGLLAPSLGCADGAVLPAGTVAPSQTPQHFTIPPQALSTALITFGKQANVQVLTAGGTIADLRSGGVEGNAPLALALSTLLRSTGLDYVFIDAATVVIRPAFVATAPGTPTPPVFSPSISDATLLAPVRAEGLIGHDTGYLADATSSATRTDTDLIDVPQSVSVITRDLMDSQQIRTVADAVRNVAGVQSLDDGSGLPYFQIRGFNTGNGMTDGMPNAFAGPGDYPPLIGLERVEVVKGPEAILGDSSTDNEFGGMINVVVKKPQSDPVRQFSFALGEYGDSQAGIDLAGPLGDSKRLTYRLVLSGEYADHTQQGYRGQRNGYIAPSIGWQGDSAKLIVGLQRIVDRVPIPDHAVLLGDTLSSASPSDLLTGNANDHATYQTSRFYYLFEQRLGTDWSFQSRGQYVHQSASQQDWTLYGGSPDGDVYAQAEASRYTYTYYTLQNDFVGVFNQGNLVTHTVTLGFDYARSQSGHGDDAVNGMPYNLFAGPPLGKVRLAVAGDSMPVPGSPWSTNNSLLLQDQIAIGESWDLLLAARRSSYKLSTYDADGNPWNLHKEQWVPNAGLVYKLSPDISLYASTASGFQPDPNLGRNGRPLEPAMSRQIEAGAKFNLFDNRARLTASWYRIMLDRSYDLPSPVVSMLPLGSFFEAAVPGPGQTNKGLELEFTGRIAPGLDVSSSYTRARVDNHDGTPAVGAPRQAFNLWASYWFQGEALRGWGVAGGVQARSRSLGYNYNYDDYISIPGQASLDANVSYRAQHWGVTLGVKNLLGRRLYDDYFDETFVPLHYRRSYLLTGSYDF